MTRDLGYYARRGSRGADQIASLATIVDCESNDAGAVAEALAGRGVDAVLSAGEYHVDIAAEVAERLGVPGLPRDAGRAARHKGHAMRRFAAANVPVPRYAVVGSIAQADQAARTVGYPLVVKPVDGTASVGVRLCETPAQVLAHVGALLHRQRNARSQRCIGEVLLVEYVPGPEVSVETISWGGRTTVFGITAKRVGPLPYFVEVSHTFPAAMAAPDAERCAAVTRSALAAIGLTHGAAHTELKVRPGGPVVIEVNARPAGDHITELMRLATGVNPLREWVRTHLDGSSVHLPPHYRRAATVRYLTPPSGTVRRIGDLDEVRRRPEVHELVVSIRPGDAVGPLRDSHDRSGYLIVCADTAGASARLAEDIHDALPIVVSAVPALVS